MNKFEVLTYSFEQDINPVEIFTSNGLDPLLERITAAVNEFDPDVTTPAGRKEIASLARKVASSKTFLDNAGKDLVSNWKDKSKKVDAERKRMRDYLDDLKEKARKPLTEWEVVEKARLEKELIEKERDNCMELAIIENDLFDRNREIEKKEAQFRKLEEERISKELAEQRVKKAEEDRALEEKKREERERMIAKEAAELAKHEAEERARMDIERHEKEIEEAKLSAEKAERDRIELIRMAEIEKEIAVKAEREKASMAAEMKEQNQLKKEAAERAENERRIADVEHRRIINNEALQSIVEHGIDSETSKKVISLICRGLVKNVMIQY